MPSPRSSGAGPGRSVKRLKKGSPNWSSLAGRSGRTVVVASMADGTLHSGAGATRARQRRPARATATPPMIALAATMKRQGHGLAEQRDRAGGGEHGHRELDDGRARRAEPAQRRVPDAVADARGQRARRGGQRHPRPRDPGAHGEPEGQRRGHAEREHEPDDLQRVRPLAGPEAPADHGELHGAEQDEGADAGADAEVGERERDRVDEQHAGRGPAPALGPARASRASASAPAASRMPVKLAASMSRAPSAARQRSELLANATSAPAVKRAVRNQAGGTTQS